MDDVRMLWWDRPELIEAVAAFCAGVVFAAQGLPLAAVSGFSDLVVAAPMTTIAPMCALLALIVGAAALGPRLPGWLAA
ncbi:hypothetical protein ACFQZ8_29885, partial [Micromonospora azadirachtae]